MDEDTAKGRLIDDILQLEKLEETHIHNVYTTMIRNLLDYRKKLYECKQDTTS